MYIKRVAISNYRNFRDFHVELKQFSIIIGENDVGKTNFLEALKLPLYANDFSFSRKVLKITDINTDVLKEFIDTFKEKKDVIVGALSDGSSLDFIIDYIPIIKVEVAFSDAKNSYERAMLKNFITEVDNEVCYVICYEFAPRRPIQVIEFMITMLDENEEVSENLFPIDLYDYKVYSAQNEKRIVNKNLSMFKVSTISADRDDFSESDNRKSNKMVSDLLHRNLSNSDKSSIHNAYKIFFDSIEDAESFKKAFNYLDNSDLKNIEDYVEQVNLIPNFPNLKNIFSNITIGYGKEFLYQKGLGTRNFILLMILFSYFYTEEEAYNLICVEEPESHLCVNKFNVLLDFISKSIKTKNSLTQVLLTSHNPKIINKLRLENIVVIKSDRVINFSGVDGKLTNYLSKRPNFDTLKLLFSKKLILVEGPTEEMFINAELDRRGDLVSEVEVLSVGHKGFRTYLDIWLILNKGNENVKIGVIRDFDDQVNAKNNHDAYDKEHNNIMVRTTEGYTFEDDLVSSSDNAQILGKLFGTDSDNDSLSKFMKEQKATNMLDISLKLTKDELKLVMPKHIDEVLKWMLE